MKTITAEPLEAGKQDEQGRRIAGEEERAKLLAAYDTSGLTQRAFARREGVNYNTFSSWLIKRRRASAPAPGQFLQLGLGTSGAYRLEVVFPDGLIVRGVEGVQVAALARALR